MAQKHPGERQSCGAHHGGGASLRTLGPSLDPEILSFSGLRDSARPAPNGTRCLTKHSSPKYTQPPNPAHWSDPSHGPPRVQDPLEMERTLIRVRHLQKKSQEWIRNSQERMRPGTRRMKALLFPFHLLAAARAPLASLRSLTLGGETALLATFATIVCPQL